MRVYLSSTYTDLERHRALLGRALRKAGYEVVMMEEYVARDARVEFACQGDVVTCDVYVGVFARRYGYIPDQDNPGRLSVTEMEYAAAGARPMPRLTFLLKEQARWPRSRTDVDLSRITDLRTRLKKQCSAFFSSAEGLAVEVMAALRVHESTRLTQQLEAVDVVLAAQALGPSYLMNLKNKLALLGQAPFIELHVGPTPWWNTRLYLVAALAHEFGCARGVVLLNGDGRFLLMAAPGEICRRLAARWPALDVSYRRFREGAATLEQVEDQLWRYPMLVGEAFGAEEQQVKHCLSEHEVKDGLGITRNAEVVEVSDRGQRFLQQEVLGRQTRFAALVRDGALEGLVDREALAQRVARAAML